MRGDDIANYKRRRHEILAQKPLEFHPKNVRFAFRSIGIRVFEVNADLLRDALQITPKDPYHPFVTPPPHDDIVSFIKMLGYPEDLEQVSKMEDFKFQIDSREISKKKKELLPFPRFTKFIIKYILSHHNNVSTRLQSYHHVIKIDAVLGNLKFANKGEKDLIYGMSIPMEMMSDEIKASAYYSNYLEKSMGDKPVKGNGKGLLTRKGV
ncbi:hypothetical protein Tco_1396329 [Tanacetum coccineum]